MARAPPRLLGSMACKKTPPDDGIEALYKLLDEPVE
jgi:hypothetical protein